MAPRIIRIVICAAVACADLPAKDPKPSPSPLPADASVAASLPAKPTFTLANLLAMTNDQLANVDPATMYLLALTGFSSGKESFDLDKGIGELNSLAQFYQMAGLGASCGGGKLDRAKFLVVYGELRKKPPENCPVPVQIFMLSLGRRMGYPLCLAQTPKGIQLCMRSPEQDCFVDLSEKEPGFWTIAGETPVQVQPGIEQIGKKPGEKPELKHWIYQPSDIFGLALAERAKAMSNIRTQSDDRDLVFKRNTLLAYAQAHLSSPKCINYIQSIRDAAQEILGYMPAPENIRERLDIKPREEPPPITNLELQKLLEKPVADLAKMDIAEVNLICAKGLPGSEKIDIPAELERLDIWASAIANIIEKNRPYFNEHSWKYSHSEGVFKMVTMIMTLQSKNGMGIHYDSVMKDMALKVEGNEEATIQELSSDAYAKNSKNMFLTGLLSDERVGTCASMPVLYVALGRRLGFPVSLVEAKGHLFVRWDDGRGERFNIEGTGNVGIFNDDYFKNWPLPISQEEIDAGQYLKSLTPGEELADFLGQRATCLRANGRFGESLVMTTEALRLQPNAIYHQSKLVKSTKVVTGAYFPW